MPARGCTQLAIIDLKENESKIAADELVQNACGQLGTLHKTGH